MNDKHFQSILEKYLDGKANPEQKEALESWYLKEIDAADDYRQPVGKNVKDQIWAGIIHEREIPITKKRALWPRIGWVAAAMFVVIGVKLLFLDALPKDKNILAEDLAIHIRPGSEKAVLTLGNGEKFSLGNKKSSTLTNQSGVEITESEDGLVVYKSIPGQSKTLLKLQYNTIETPLGGQYRVKLSDGTNIYLNASSKLKFPIVFSGKERIVELSGEGYFEVSHNSHKPFKVVSSNQTIEVLGTHFNVMSYPGEKLVKTTLIEGSIKINGGKLSKTLTPGQQAIVSQGNIVITNHLDLEDVVAWKNGYFKFNGNLEDIMSQIEKWYDVEVVYRIKPENNVALQGEISRKRGITEVLKMLEFTANIHFEIEGRRIIVKE